MNTGIGLLMALGVVTLGILMIADPRDWLMNNVPVPEWVWTIVGVLVVLGGIVLGIYLVTEQGQQSVRLMRS